MTEIDKWNLLCTDFKNILTIWKMAQIIVMCILKFLFIYNRYTGTGDTLIERKVMVNYLIGFDNLKQCRERYDEQI